MNEEQTQALAAEWHQRYMQAERQVTQYAAGVGDIGYTLTACLTFAFFAGAETQWRWERRKVSEDDKDAYIACTVHEALRALSDAGIDIQRLDTLQALLKPGVS